MVRLVLAALVLIGCHTSSTEPIIAEPGEQAPLPPASGTAIGLLLDDTRMKLTPAQSDRLHEIDQQLETRNESLEAQLREMDHPAESGGGDAASGRGHRSRMSMTGSGMSGGGMPGGGMPGGGMSGGGGRHHRGGGGQAGASGPPTNNAPQAPTGARRRIADEEAANTKDALAKAFAALDPDQRETAETILKEHGVSDAPAEPVEAEPAAGEPASAPGTDDGQ